MSDYHNYHHKVTLMLRDLGNGVFPETQGSSRNRNAEQFYCGAVDAMLPVGFILFAV